MLATKISQWVYMDPQLAFAAMKKARLANDSPPLSSFDAEKLARTCLNCGAAMRNFQNRLVCTCGFYVSGADFV